MAEFEVSGGGEAVLLQLVRFDRSRPAVMMDVGPVLHPDDLLGSKAAAMATVPRISAGLTGLSDRR
jgi:hypothetical protein